MHIPRQSLYSALAGSFAIVLVVWSARAQTLTPQIVGEPSRSQPGASSPQQRDVVVNCDEQIKNRFADNPDGSRASYELGLCYLSSKKLDDAAAAFQKAIQLIPEWIKEIEGKDTSHLPKKQKEELQRNASPSLARFSLGWAYHQAGRYDEAVAAYQQIQSVYPVAEEARYQTAMVHLMRGDRAAALEQVAKMGKRFEQRLDIESKLLIPDLIQSDESISKGAPIIQMSRSIRPSVLHYEKAKYTEEARQVKLEGTVELQVIFRSDGVLVIQRVIRYLPYGLTLTAVEAASKFKFKPAMMDGSPVNVRGSFEFTLTLH